MVHILVLVLDLGGTFVFAISGAMVGIRSRLDVFGVLVLSFAAGNAGGITRDLLIGVAPPAAVSDWRYFFVSAIAGIVTFLWYPVTERYSKEVLWLDAIGLAFFATAGAEKALIHGIHPMMAALLGMLTGIGGGILRDVLVSGIPSVLRSDLYALAALAGASVVVSAHLLHIPPTVAAVSGGTLCFALRFMAIRHGWRLPEARPEQAPAPNASESQSNKSS